MVTINKATVAWDGLANNLCRAIKEWQPTPLPREIDYRNSLAAHIRESAPSAHVECEYRHSGTTVDIYVQWEGLIATDTVYIEMKRNLNTKAEYNRLIGQLDDLKAGRRQVIVVLCGKTDPKWLDRLKSRCGRLIGLGLWICVVAE